MRSSCRRPWSYDLNVCNGWKTDTTAVRADEGCTMGRVVIKWLVASGAAMALATAMLLWGGGPASECSTPHQIRWWGGLPVFSLFVAAGAYVVARGSVAQRVLLIHRLCCHCRSVCAHTFHEPADGY